MIRDDMLERMSAEEFEGWREYESLESFGEQRADLRAGLQWIADSNMWIGKGRAPLGLDDYPLLAAEKKNRAPVTSASVFNALKMLADATKTKPS